jgi:hypothetical protein
VQTKPINSSELETVGLKSKITGAKVGKPLVVPNPLPKIFLELKEIFPQIGYAPPI